jgi:uncharacterized membrane protein YkvA (DUF1232 family)
MASGFGSRIARGRLFARLKEQAAAYVRDPERLRGLLARATAKANAAGGRGALAEVWESLLTLFRLLRAYARGDYRNVPGKSLVLIVAAVLYFLMPIDLIPDVIVGLGFVDDVAILAWVVSTVSGVLEDFRKWENVPGGAGTPPPPERPAA